MKQMHLIALIVVLAATAIMVPLFVFQRSGGQTTPTSPTQASTKQATNGDNGTVVSLRVGDKLNITLNTNSAFNINPTWEFNGSSNSRVLAQDGSPKFIQLSIGPCPSSPCGVDSIAFKAITSGTAVVVASEYGSCAEPAVVGDNCMHLFQQSFEITVVVSSA